MAIGWKSVTLFTSAYPDNIQADSDSNKFVFVDGRDNNAVRRVAIDSEGVIDASEVGILAPSYPPELYDIKTSNTTGEGTGLTRGTVLQYAYCYLNKWGERSNPSPALIVDSFQWQQKGYYTDEGGDYVYGDRSGSIKSVSIGVNIDTSDVEKVELYRGQCEYPEDVIPLDNMKLISITTISAGASLIVLSDSAPAQSSIISYENSSSPSGDDITLSSGTTFIANAKSSMPILNADIYTITINNKNSKNYINEWFRIDLHDNVSKKTGESYIDINWEEIDESCVRIVSNDLTTPVLAYIFRTPDTYDSKMLLKGIGADIDYTARMMAFLRIPYVPAYMETVVYLCVFNCDTNDIPVYLLEPTYVRADSYEELSANIKKMCDEFTIQCPVRSAGHLISQNAQKGVQIPPNLISAIDINANKANDRLNSNRSMGALGTYPFLYDERIAKLGEIDIREGILDSNVSVFSPRFMDGDSFSSAYTYNNDVQTCPKNGWASGYFEMNKGDSNIEELALIHIRFGVESYMKMNVVSTDGSYTLYMTAYIRPGIPEVRPLFSAEATGIRVYAYFTWEHTIIDGCSTLKIAPTLLISDHGESEDWSSYKLSQAYSEGFTVESSAVHDFEPFEVKFLAWDQYGFMTASGNFNISGDGYFPSRENFFAAIRNLPMYDVDGIGANDNIHNDNNGIPRCYNKNVIFDTLVTALNVNNDSVGVLQWDKYGSMSDLNTKNINDEIMRIASMKSLQPTDEHSTIIAITKDDVYRVALLGNSSEFCETIREIKDMGLSNRRAFCNTRNGIAWLSNKGLVEITSDGFKYHSYGRIAIPVDSVLVFDHVNNWIYVNYSGGSKVYQVDEDVWWFNNNPTPSRFLGTVDGVEGWICADNKIYTYGTTPALTEIKTRAFKLIRKLGRFMVVSSSFIDDAYTFAINLFGRRFTGGTGRVPSGTATYSGKNNYLTSAPNTSADYAQIDIINCDNVVAIEIEDLVGKDG